MHCLTVINEANARGEFKRGGNGGCLDLPAPPDPLPVDITRRTAVSPAVIASAEAAIAAGIFRGEVIIWDSGRFVAVVLAPPAEVVDAARQALSRGVRAHLSRGPATLAITIGRPESLDG